MGINPGWWFGTMECDFFHILGRIIPTDELIFFRGVEISPKHILFSPIVGMMIQFDFHIFQGG
jgi:hypothetical protein